MEEAINRHLSSHSTFILSTISVGGSIVLDLSMSYVTPMSLINFLRVSTSAHVAQTENHYLQHLYNRKEKGEIGGSSVEWSFSFYYY